MKLSLLQKILSNEIGIAEFKRDLAADIMQYSAALGNNQDATVEVEKDSDIAFECVDLLYLCKLYLDNELTDTDLSFIADCLLQCSFLFADDTHLEKLVTRLSISQTGQAVTREEATAVCENLVSTYSIDVPEPTPEEFAVPDCNEDPEAQRIKNLIEEEEEKSNIYLREVISNLGLTTCEFPYSFESFEMFKTIGKDFYPEACYVSSVLPLHVITNYLDGSCFLFGIMGLGRTYPQTYIHQEKVAHRVINWFTKTDTDFQEYKKFSSSFQVITNEKEKLLNQLMGKPLDDLAAYPAMQAEINGNVCLFRLSEEPLGDQNGQPFIQLAKLLNKLFN
jgi:hypothetical protein